MQQKLAEKEKAAKEENLRMLAQRAREERAGIPAKPTAERQAAMKSALGGYGSGSESGSDSESEPERERAEEEEDEESAQIRDRMREEIHALSMKTLTPAEFQQA